jgi:hypothetical protein
MAAAGKEHAVPIVSTPSQAIHHEQLSNPTLLNIAARALSPVLPGATHATQRRHSTGCWKRR